MKTVLVLVAIVLLALSKKTIQLVTAKAVVANTN
jgi:hypothetical protein